MVIRVAITGPESTGKSQLAEQLADCYGTLWVPEFAREYIGLLDRPYSERDILTIAQGQLEREQAAETWLKERAEPSQRADQHLFLFCDTELLVTKIWSDVKFGRCDPWILDRLEFQSHDLYLLCYIDTPWEPDPQREHPHRREQLFTLYYNEMLERGWNFRVVTGLHGERLANAINLIETSLD